MSGTQFKVAKHDLVAFDLMDVHTFDVDTPVTFPRVLAVGSKTQTLLGRPYLQGAQVKGVVEQHVKGEKVTVFKKKRRKGYKRKRGFRPLLSFVRITDITQPEAFQWDGSLDMQEVPVVSLGEGEDVQNVFEVTSDLGEDEEYEEEEEEEEQKV